MRPDQIPINARPTPHQILTRAQNNPHPIDVTGYRAKLGALFTHTPTRKLNHTLAARPVIAQALNAGDIRLDPHDHLTLTAQGRARLEALTTPTKTNAYIRRGTSWQSDPTVATRPGAFSLNPTPAPPPTRNLTIATDASQKDGVIGISAVADDYRWAMTGYANSTRNQPATGHVIEPVLGSELRAIALAVHFIRPGQSATILTGSQSAIRTITRWRSGSTTTPNPNHLPTPPHPHHGPTSGASLYPGNLALTHLRTHLIDHPEIVIAHVHAGHHLNEAADSLAKMVRRSTATPTPTRHDPSGLLLAEIAIDHVHVMVNAHHEL